MAVDVKSGGEFQPGVPKALFEVSALENTRFDAAKDGRFLITTTGASQQAANTPITVVVNWPSGLRP